MLKERKITTLNPSRHAYKIHLIQKLIFPRLILLPREREREAIFFSKTIHPLFYFSNSPLKNKKKTLFNSLFKLIPPAINKIKRVRETEKVNFINRSISRGNRIKRFTWFECRTGDYRERISSKSARFPGLVGPRIIGGESAAIEEYPFVVSITCDRSSRSIWHLENRCLSSQVSLQNNGTFFGHQVEHFCGGSIVGEKWIITSAQCALRQDWYIVFEQYLRVHAICVRISIAYFFFPRLFTACNKRSSTWGRARRVITRAVTIMVSKASRFIPPLTQLITTTTSVSLR